jgi:hypothetical protein
MSRSVVRVASAAVLLLAAVSTVSAATNCVTVGGIQLIESFEGFSATFCTTLRHPHPPTNGRRSHPVADRRCALCFVSFADNDAVGIKTIGFG